MPRELIAPAFNAIAQPLQAEWQLHFSDTMPRLTKENKNDQEAKQLELLRQYNIGSSQDEQYVR